MATYSTAPNKFIFIFSGLIIAGVVLYYAFLLVDRYFLSETALTATVVGKEYVPFSEEYRTQHTGSRVQTVKVAIPETWLLTFTVDGKPCKAQVSRQDYEDAKNGENINIKYKKHRITGTCQVTAVIGRTGE